MKQKEGIYDFIIVGAGLAGLYAALLASKNFRVALLCKTTIEISNSYWAQGGVAAAIGPDDSAELHFEDTIKAGRGLCNREAVSIMVNEGRNRIFELIEMGMPFDKKNGNIALGLEGGHSRRRVLHAGGDATGKEIVNFILKLIAKNHNIEIFENTLVYKILIDNNICRGVYAFDWMRQKSFLLNGRAVFVATGGGSAIYKRTTNPHTSIGEGITLAYDAGAEIESMEFIQFHPTSFYSSSGKTFLISEAVRGEGAYLINDKGERFLKSYRAEAELSPRDVVSEAIYYELKNSGKQNVYLDLRHLDAAKIKERFRNIYNEALKYGVDIQKDLVPVLPAAHYMIGGIKTDLNAQTNLNGLFAIGEVASTGVHGANRLASNSLLECLVFAKRAVDCVANNSCELQAFDNPATQGFYVDSEKQDEYCRLKDEVAKLMSDKIGIVRSKDSLASAKTEFEKILSQTKFNEQEYYSSRAKNVLELGWLIANSALIREESRGCHLREDFPEENDKFLFKIVQNKSYQAKLLPVN